MRRTLLCLACALPLALVGCEGGDETATERHEVDAHGFALSVPADWRPLKAGDVLQGEEVEEFRRDNPEVAAYLDAVAGPDSPVKFLAVDPNVEDDFATSVNVVVLEIGEATPETWADAAVAELEALGTITGEIARERLDLPGGECLRLAYRQRFELDGAERMVSTTQYGFVAGGRAYVVTFTTLPGQEEQYSDTFGAAAKSFRITA